MADRRTSAAAGSGNLLTSARMRAVLFQLIAMAAVIAVVGFAFSNAMENLERRGIASGFGFLDSTAGFGIIMSLVEYSETSSFGRAFVVGLLNTLLVAAIGIVLATVIGFAIGIADLPIRTAFRHAPPFGDQAGCLALLGIVPRRRESRDVENHEGNA